MCVCDFKLFLPSEGIRRVCVCVRERERERERERNFTLNCSYPCLFLWNTLDCLFGYCWYSYIPSPRLPVYMASRQLK